MFSICSAVFCIFALFLTETLWLWFPRPYDYNMPAVKVGLVLMTVAFIAFNWLFYYHWDIVRSAYLQLKNENEAILPPGPYELRHQISQTPLIPPQPTTKV